MNVQDVSSKLGEWFPLRLAEPWDNVGLLLGDPKQDVRRIMTCLSVTTQTATEATREHADLVVVHHPIFFRKLQRLLSTGPDGAAFQLARAGIAVYSPHTAFDGGRGGINEQIANLLELNSIRPLRPALAEKNHKLVVFVPEGDLDRVSQAIFSQGGGIIGEYSECSYRVHGTGTFRGSEKSHPTIGKPGEREEVSEYRLEVLVPNNRLADVLSAMIAAHSYEEPGYDVYPFEPLPSDVGAGRIGRLSSSVTLAELAAHVQERLSSPHVEYVGAADQLCTVVGIGCGAAYELVEEARRGGADVFITGEARFHDLLAARESGTGLIVAGHDATERFALATLADRLQREFPDLVVWASRDESNPTSITR